MGAGHGHRDNRFPLCYPAGGMIDDQGIQSPLHLLDTGGQRPGGIVGKDGNGPLCQDAPPVVLLVHQMNGGSGHPGFRGQDRVVHPISVHPLTPEGRKERGVHVEDPTRVGPDEARGEQAQVPSQHHKADPVLGEGVHGVPGHRIRSPSGNRNDPEGASCQPGVFQGTDALPITDDQFDAPGGGGGLVLKEGPEGGSRPGSEDGHRRHASSPPVTETRKGL